MCVSPFGRPPFRADRSVVRIEHGYCHKAAITRAEQAAFPI